MGRSGLFPRKPFIIKHLRHLAMRSVRRSGIGRRPVGRSRSSRESGEGLVALALGEAAQRISEDTEIVFRPQVDQDTQGVPGSPDVSVEILRKIGLCYVFVADVTLTYPCQSGPARSSPNPNVLIELGYAVKCHGWPRVLQVLNAAYGKPEELPFDLRSHLALTFSHANGQDPEPVVAALTDDFERELRLILTAAGPAEDPKSPVELDLTYKKRSIDFDRHQYRLIATATNRGTQIVSGWAVEIRLPRGDRSAKAKGAAPRGSCSPRSTEPPYSRVAAASALSRCPSVSLCSSTRYATSVARWGFRARWP